MTFGSGESKRKAIFLVMILFMIILALTFLVSGFQGVASMIKTFFTLSLVVLFIGFLIYIVYFLFFAKHKTDVNYLNFRNIIASAKLSKPPLMNDLYLRGDKEHMSARLGKIMGYCRLENIATREKEDVFVIDDAPFPLSLLSEPKVVRIKDTEHSALIGDIFIKGLSLIKLGSFYYLNNAMLDTKMIDEAQELEGIRIVAHTVLADVKGLVDLATGIDSEHKKSIEGKSLMNLPSGSKKENE